jgi:hypothetical protein
VLGQASLEDERSRRAFRLAFVDELQPDDAGQHGQSRLSRLDRNHATFAKNRCG